MVPGEESYISPPCDTEMKEEGLEESSQDHILDGALNDEGFTEDPSPVVHMVTSMAEEVTSGAPGHVQLSYPLLASTSGLEESSNITLSNISCSGHVEPLDVESLLNNEATASDGALIIAQKEDTEVLPATIAECTVRDCEEVVILTKVSEETDEINQEMHPQPTIKLWIPSDNSELEQQRMKGDGGGDILIVSSGTFTEAGPAVQLDPEIGQQVVQTMILEGSDAAT